MLGRMASGALSQQRPARLDRHLERAVRGLLAHDDRVRGLDVHVDFAGGVAHLTGKVGSVDRLTRLRGLIGELAGVFALLSRPWGFGNSLEWATSCPPPLRNFTRLPRIRSERPAFDLKHGSQAEAPVVRDHASG